MYYMHCYSAGKQGERTGDLVHLIPRGELAGGIQRVETLSLGISYRENLRYVTSATLDTR